MLESPVNSANTPKLTRPCIFIFRHEASIFDFIPSLSNEIYYFNDSKFVIVNKDTNIDEHAKLFVDYLKKGLLSNHTIFVLDFNPANAFCVYILTVLAPENYPIKQHSISFFHDDNTTSHLSSDDGASILDLKSNILVDMLDFPYIKKIEIPINSLLTKENILEMLEDKG
ncbi:MAG: hypothetical protein LBH43_14625 [Treponema sp.]|jgi:hypothetical protein|nr:hypothetical protein [Treponema sp.]